jgi:hypothetical protein
MGLTAVDDNSLTVPGTFHFKFDFSAAELDYFTNAGTYSCAVKFDPADSVHFNSVECIRTIEVLPATIPVVHQQYRLVCDPSLPDIVVGVALPDCTKHIRDVDVSDNITVPGAFDFTPKCFANPGPQFSNSRRMIQVTQWSLTLATSFQYTCQYLFPRYSK